MSLGPLARLLVVAAMCVLPSGVVVPAATADDSALVTWDSDTTINSHEATYQVTVTDVGVDDLVAVWYDQRLPVAHVGTTRLPLHDGDGVVFLLRCGSGSGSDTCTQVSVSPSISVHGKVTAVLDTTYGGGVVRVPSRTSQRLFLSPAVRGDEVTIRSTLRNRAGRVMSSGTTHTTVTPRQGEQAAARFALAVPAGVPSGRYPLSVDVELDDPGFGHLADSYRVPVAVDAHPPRVRISLDHAVVYPQTDGYRDTLVGHITASSRVRATVSAVGSEQYSGFAPRVHRLSPHEQVFRWDPIVDGGVAPPGRYVLRFFIVDRLGYQQMFRRTVRLRPERLTYVTWRRTFSAAGSRIAQSVGACSRLTSPGTDGVAGSLGYLSGVRCRRASQAYVLTAHGIYLPRSVATREPYQHLRIGTRGGRARGAAKAYLVFGIIRAGGQFTRVGQFDGRRGIHPVSIDYLRGLTGRDRQGRAVLEWEVGLAEGSRYDVDGFTVSVQYLALRKPRY